VENNYSISNNTVIFLQGIEEFAKKNVSFAKFRDLLKTGLSVFTSLYFFKCAHFYLLNQDSYEFEYYISEPEFIEGKELLDITGKEEVLNLVLTLGKIQSSYNEKLEKHILYIPLISIDGVLGIVLLESSLVPEEIDILTFRFIRVFASYLANSINTFIVKDNEKRAQEILGQVVALKTLELKESHTKLGEKIKDLTSNLSMLIPHEIRTPINQILGSTNYLKKFISMLEIENAEDVREILDDIDKSTARLKRLTENYIFYSNLVVISTDLNEIEKLRHDVTASASSVIYDTAMTKAYSYNRQEDFVINLVDSDIALNESFFIKVIEEITDNACKFSPPSSKIILSSYNESNYYVLSIKDFGIGMTEEEISNIGPFVQFDRHLYEQQGSGMGLTIALKILNIHGCLYDIQSKKGEFTEFIIKFPVSRK
jgi:signal transduction histidine kinase